jgi:deferrochelatase/peroxidase EfeB
MQIADRHTDDHQERGLVFVALNANIERQFEFVQQAWISAPSFAGLYDEADPLLGGRTQTAGVFSMPEADLRRRRQGVLPHVKVQGGEYFFLPSIRALNYLSA